MAVLIGPDALVNLDGQTWGKIAILGARTSYSLAWIYGQRLKKHPLAVAAARMLVDSSV